MAIMSGHTFPSSLIELVALIGGRTSDRLT
jgi:hypothetical protein